MRVWRMRTGISVTFKPADRRRLKVPRVNLCLARCAILFRSEDWIPQEELLAATLQAVRPSPRPDRVHPPLKEAGLSLTHLKSVRTDPKDPEKHPGPPISLSMGENQPPYARRLGAADAAGDPGVCRWTWTPRDGHRAWCDPQTTGADAGHLWQ
jgi:hypothetical protein